MGLNGVELRVYGRVMTSRDSRGRQRPLAGSTVTLTALADSQGVLRRIPTAGGTNPITVDTDANGRFDQRTFWAPQGAGAAAVEPEAFDVDVTDPDGGLVVSAGRVFSNGDAMEIDSGLVPTERPLATVTGGRDLEEIAELAAYLAAGLDQPSKLGEVTLWRPQFETRDERHPTGAERLFRHFSTLLDRLQAALRTAREQSPGGNRGTTAVYVPTGFKPLEERVLRTFAWFPKTMPAAERCRRLVAQYGTENPGEELLRRVVPRLTMMLGQILELPVVATEERYLWEDLATLLTIVTGIGLVSQHNHIVWADYLSDPGERRLVLSMV